ncbi:hypothetical protein [Gilvimarinus chinensis]|uniref:hypothetical protein n=1 Tax=Gilvimarinus chinensis TaxID=396005 RepID=UPI00035DBDB6|nr:hypothetical protein [Gilvimarinus chinensis]
MAFDYGSIDLGLKNPFKPLGWVTALAGAAQSALGIVLLVSAVGYISQSQVAAWILVAFGMFILIGGLRRLGGGIFATLRYFVGRNPPTSLARNFAASEASGAEQEAKYVAYSDKTLEEMLMGRKNATFIEPSGLLARLLHSLFPRLLYMPYPIRNAAQQVFGAWVKTLTAVIAYAVVAFVSLTGLAGDWGPLLFPFYSLFLAVALGFIWRSAGRGIDRSLQSKVTTLGAGGLVKVLIWSLLIPAIIAVAVAFVAADSKTAVQAAVDSRNGLLQQLHIWLYIFGTLLVASVVCAVVGLLLAKRLRHAQPLTEVSELRENWQESVHPNEIFINLDNLVMANRRYKEVPNRVYRVLEPKLREQVDGKGEFSGQLLQEIQPQVAPMELGKTFDLWRFIGTIAGQVLFVLAALFTLFAAYKVVDIYTLASSLSQTDQRAIEEWKIPASLSDPLLALLHLLLLGFLCRAFGRILANACRMFYAEIQFQSLLVYFKCEGTFTESKISTGTGIHDSTRSENILVRSSITPWVITSRLVSTTFADTGMRNLEFPRYILEMHKAETDIEGIRADVIAFLKDRESIASITSERDLGNASQIHQINQQTRASLGAEHKPALEQDSEKGGYLRREADLASENDDENVKR